MTIAHVPTISPCPSPSWTLLHTRSWHDDLRRRDQHTQARLTRFLRFLRDTPFAPGTNLKPLSGRPHTYRWRCGDFRLTYRIDQATRTVVLLRFANRRDVYRSTDGGKAVGIVDAGMPITNVVSPRPALIPADPTDTEVQENADQSSALEEIESIVTPEELFLIGVPTRWWEALSRITSETDLQAVAVPDEVRRRVLDYCTNPASTHIGRLYALEPSATCADVARRPLHEFLVRLDPAQQAIVDLPRERAPLLIRGGPGTGKSLVALYRLRNLIDSNATVQLVWRRYAFITYTKSLAVASEQLFARLLDGPLPSGVTVEFKTLDSIAGSLVRTVDRVEERRAESRVVTDDFELQTYVRRAAQSRGKEALAIVGQLGATYILEEF